MEREGGFGARRESRDRNNKQTPATTFAIAVAYQAKRIVTINIPTAIKHIT